MSKEERRIGAAIRGDRNIPTERILTRILYEKGTPVHLAALTARELAPILVRRRP